jgi:DNA topoisomerase-1
LALAAQRFVEPALSLQTGDDMKPSALATPLRIVRPARPRARVPRVPTDPVESAALAQLRYVSDAGPGIRRRRASRGFRYVGDDGKPIRDLDTLRRIKRLAIPPAWVDVWICPDPRGHLQAVGRDAKGRKQYRYHPRWREVRDATKYARMIAFGRGLPALRRRVARDLALPGLPRDKVLATVVRLLEATRIRVGNEEYARKNRSYGLTTLRSQHVKVDGATLRFEFRGKGGKRHAVGVADRRLARVVRRCQDLPGYELFQYIDDDGSRQAIDSADVNEYLRGISGQDFTAKDFRTWEGTVQAARELQKCAGSRPTKRAVAQAIASVAEQLGNTPAICRRCYVHPAVLEAYLSGAPDPVGRASGRRRGLAADETRVLAILERAEMPARRRRVGGRR